MANLFFPTKPLRVVLLLRFLNVGPQCAFERERCCSASVPILLFLSACGVLSVSFLRLFMPAFGRECILQ